MAKVLSKQNLSPISLQVKVAENQYEIERALSLRYEVFNKELGEGLPESHTTKKDRDEYDYFCDHLIVLNQESDTVVGTYRILRKEIAQKTIGFYSENEFDLFNLYQIDSEIAEVGRSCVHLDYRDGSVINYLWRGLAEYMKSYHIQFYFGCASLHSTSPEKISNVYNYLKLKNAFTQIYVPPKYKENTPIFSANSLECQDMKSIPPLFKGYLRLGAQFSSTPTIDPTFGTTDFFVLFNKEHITNKYSNKFNLQND